VQAQRVNGTFGAQPYALVATTKQNFEASANNLSLNQVREGALSGLVFADSNRNGLREEGEAGIEGLVVDLKQVNGTLSLQSTTNATGAYQFANLPLDAYTISIILPGGFRVTTTTSTVQVNTGSTAGPTIGIIGQLFLPLVQR
jgi:SdrD B-like domain